MAIPNDPNEIDPTKFNDPGQGTPLPPGFGQPQNRSQPARGNWTEGWRDFQGTNKYDHLETGPFQQQQAQQPAGPMGPELPMPDVTGGVGGSMGPEDPNAAREGLAGPPTPEESMGMPSPSTPATDGAGPPAPTDQDRRRQEKQAEQERFNQLMTERARARRGLPAMFEEARASISGGAEAVAAFRGGAVNQAAAQQTQQAPEQQPRKYRTGETVQLTGIPGGQESTTVYSMGDGITVPDSQGMTAEDFDAAFKQLNPGKSSIDAIQSLAREPGTQGNAARVLLRDIGATGGTPLSSAQREQLTQRLSGRASELLMGHAQGMGSGIESGRRALLQEQKDQERLAEEERGRRETVLDRSRKRLDESIKSGNTARSLDSFIEEEYDLMMQEEAFFRGEGPAPQRQTERAPRIDITESNRRPGRVPATAMPEGGYMREDGLLEYKTEGLPRAVPAILYESDATPAGGMVIPVIENDDQAKALPSGQAYVTTDGQFKPGRGQAGRPSADGGTTAPATTRSVGRKDEAEDIGKRLIDAKNDLVKERNDEFEKKYSGRVDQIEQLKFKLAETGMVGTARENTIAELQKREAELEELRKAEVQDPTPEEVRERVVGERTALREATKVGQDIRFYEGDPQIFADRTTESLPEGSQVFSTSAGPVISFGDQNIPAKMIGKTAVASPSGADQIAALERGSRGNTPVSSMGTDELGVVSSDSYKRSTELRSGLSSLASENPDGLIMGGDPSIMEKIDEFITSKYPDLPIEQRPAIAKAVAESVGFRTTQITPEEMQSRRQAAGFGEVYDGAARQSEALKDKSPTIAASSFIRNFEQRYGFDRNEMVAEMGAGPYYQMIEKSFAEDARTKALGELDRTNPDLPYMQKVEMASRMAAGQMRYFEEAISESGFDRATMLNMRRTDDEIINLLQGRD